MAKNSQGIIGNWFNSQCVNLDTDFDLIKYKYGVGTKAIYNILKLKSPTSIRNRMTYGQYGKSSSRDIYNTNNNNNGCVKKLLLIFIIFIYCY